MIGWVILIAFLLLMLSISAWLALRVKRHPEKDRGMRRVMAEQRGAEYEKGMQKFFMVNYLSTGLAWVIVALLEIFFDVETFPAMLIACCALCLVLVIAKWRFTGEFSKLGLVAFAIGVVLTAIYFCTLVIR